MFGTIANGLRAVFGSSASKSPHSTKPKVKQPGPLRPRLEHLEARDCPASLTFDFHSSFRTHFGNDSSKGAYLPLFIAGQTLSDLIEPTGLNAVNQAKYDLGKLPTKGGTVSLKGTVSVAADTIHVIVGAGPFAGDKTGQGGWTSQSNRGNTKLGGKGGTPTVGYVWFDSDRSYSFDVNNPPGSGKTDFLSVALHEMGHVLGLDHLPNGTKDANGREAAMDPSIDTAPFRKLFTGRDVQLLKDRGWALVQDNNGFIGGSSVTDTGLSSTKRQYTTTGFALDNAIDVDMFKLRVTAGETVSVKVSSSSLTPWVRLFDATGKLVASGLGGVTKRLTAGGTYYVGISGILNREYDARNAGWYTLASFSDAEKYNLKIALS